MSAPAERPEVSVVMPCLNEAETLGTCIRKAHQAIQAHGLQAEVLVADNGSQDGSVEIAERLGARVVHVPVRGYGAALMAGIEAARGEYVVMGDADDSYDFLAIAPFVDRLREGHDLVMGCRFPRGGGRILPGAMPWSHRWLGNPVISALGRRLFGGRVSDSQCGLRAFRRAAILGLDLRTTGMEFAAEMVIRATLARLRIAEIPVTLSPDGRSRPPHLRTWRDGWRYLRFMLLYSPDWLFLYPGLVLLLLGVAGGAVLLPGPVVLGVVTFDVSTLLVFALCVLLGVQLVALGAFARVFAVSEGLLPPDPRLERVLGVVTLEAGVVAGLLVGLLGAGLIGVGVLHWREHGFGPLSYPDILRRVIPGVTAVVLGAQTVSSAFFLSVLGLRRK